ncbi:MAG: hypothetical protein AB7E47_16620 [Desulfovibrionaceae bacterium]
MPRKPLRIPEDALSRPDAPARTPRPAPQPLLAPHPGPVASAHDTWFYDSVGTAPRAQAAPQHPAPMLDALARTIIERNRQARSPAATAKRRNRKAVSRVLERLFDEDA